MSDGGREEVEKILRYCRGSGGVANTRAAERKLKDSALEIDGEGKNAKWDPCKTLINDAIHGPVELNSLLTAILDTPEFQRLRFIKQLGGGCYVYPGANHTRFDHSIGVSYIAGEFGNHLKSQFEEEDEYKKLGNEHPRAVSDKEVLCLQIAGLCHDLGHGPFSHTFEHRVLDQMDVKLSHEQISLKVFKQIMTNRRVLIQFAYVYKLRFIEFLLIMDMIHPKRDRSEDEKIQLLTTRPQKKFLLEIVANKTSGIDVDKWDYFTRDCHYLGIAMDFQWKRCMLLSRVCKDAGTPDDNQYHIAFRNKEVDNLYGMGRTRSTLHRKACVHKTKVAVEEMFARAINKVKDVPLLNVTVKGQHHDRQTIKEAIGFAKDGNLQGFIALNDVSVTTLIMHWKPLKDSEKKYDAIISEARILLERIDKRKLYHLVEEAMRFPKYQDHLRVKPTVTEHIASWNVTNMMTSFETDNQKEMKRKERLLELEMKRKERLLELNIEVFGKDTPEANNTFIEIVSISFGSETKTDPMDDVLFYGKAQPDNATKWSVLRTNKKSSSLVVPKHFTEYEIRLYYTGIDENTLSLSDKFKSWLAKMNILENDKYCERRDT